MELTFYTDYSLRALIYLGVQRGRRCQISDIADAYGISRNHLTKVVHGLARAGFIHSYRGKGGGITLAREAREINIGAVVRYTEGPLEPVECFRGSDNRCVITGACGLAGVVGEACENFLATFDRYTLADLIAQQRRLARLLDASHAPVSVRTVSDTRAVAGRKSAAPRRLSRSSPLIARE
jgi:Rrf2 family nitric oxide-sensitive transcriptional repressor